jgi:hypothetical protein
VNRSDYDAIKGRVNFSSLKHMADSPAHYRWHLLNPEDKDTDAMRLGSVTHIATLEPVRLETDVAVWTGGRRAGKEWDAFEAQARGKCIVTSEQMDRAMAMAIAVRHDPIAAAYLKAGKAEVSLTWTAAAPAIAGVPGYAIDCKGRLDWLGESAVVELKTCRDASPDALAKAALDGHWHVQLAWYHDAAMREAGRSLPCKVIAVESEAPHVVTVLDVPAALIERGRRTYRDWLAALALCREADVWPGYVVGETELVLPKWAHDYEQESA